MGEPVKQTAVVAARAPVRCQPGVAPAFHPGLQPGELPSPAGLSQGSEGLVIAQLQVKLIKMGGRIVRHARRVVFQMAEVAVSRDLLAAVLERLTRRRLAPG